MRFLNSLFGLFKALLAFDLKLALSTFSFIVLQSASSGVTFLMLLPLLAALEEGGRFVAPTSRFSFFFAFFPSTLLSILVVFSFLMCCTAYIVHQGQKSSTTLQQNYNQFLRTMIYRAILGSNWGFLASQKKSDLVYLLMTETQNVALCNQQLLTLMNQVLMIGVYTVIACYVSWSMTLIAVSISGVLLAFMFPIHRKMSNAGHLNLKANQLLQQVVSEQLGAVKWIKGTGLEAYSMAQFQKVGEALQQQHIQFQMALAQNKLLYACCSAFFFCALLYVGIQYLAIPLSQFFVLLVIYARVLPMVASSQQVYQTLLHKISSYTHIQALLKEMQHHQEGLGGEGRIAFQHSIAFQHVFFKHPNTERWLFFDFNLNIRKNKTIALIGPSGVGKTTLVDLVVGLVEPLRGQIKVDNESLSSSNKMAWRQSIAYMTQDVFLFNASIRENLVGLLPEVSESELCHALNLASAQFVFDLPEKLDTKIGDNGVLLSGGERQRLGLARAILQKPALLILDESTNALDEQCAAHIYHSLRELQGKMTILIISHDKIPSLVIDEVVELAPFRDERLIVDAVC